MFMAVASFIFLMSRQQWRENTNDVMARVRCAIRCRNIVEWNATGWISEQMY
jgi:hypothetical protein